jgi:hypothetical protein
MLYFLLGIVVGAGVTLLVCAPQWLSWPASVRWALSSQSTGSLGFGLGAACASPLAFQEVVLVDVSVNEQRLELHGEEVGGSTARKLVLTGAVPEPGLIARLEGWCAAATPLFVFGHDACDRAQLLGPDASVPHLPRVPALRT